MKIIFSIFFLFVMAVSPFWDTLNLCVGKSHEIVLNKIEEKGEEEWELKDKLEEIVSHKIQALSFLFKFFEGKVLPLSYAPLKLVQDHFSDIPTPPPEV